MSIWKSINNGGVSALSCKSSGEIHKNFIAESALIHIINNMGGKETFGYGDKGRKEYEKTEKGDKDMNYKIVKKESFTVTGKERIISMIGSENFKQVPQFWSDCMGDGSYELLCAQAGALGVLGICKNFDKDEFVYMIGVEGNNQPLPEGCVSTVIPAATWAIFEAVGALPKSIQDLLPRILTEWMPANGYRHDCVPELEVYLPGDMCSSDYKCEIWIPVKK